MGMAQFPVPLAPSKLSIPGLNDYQNLKRYGNRHMENFSHASTDIWSTQRDPGSIQRAVNVEHCQGYKENQDSVATKVGLESIWPKPFEHVTTATTTGCSSSRWLDMSIGLHDGNSLSGPFSTKPGWTVASSKSANIIGMASNPNA